MAVTQTCMTVEEFLALPEEKPALEFEDRVVSQKVSPKAQHSVLQLSFTERVNHQMVQLKLARAFQELRATFGGRSYVPDVAVFRWDRIPFLADGRVANDFFEPPDIAVEIVSPEQSVNALVRRCIWYVDNGVRIALLIDPDDTSVIRFLPGQPPVVLHGDDPIDLSEVLVDFSLTVRELFDSLRFR